MYNCLASIPLREPPYIPTKEKRPSPEIIFSGLGLVSGNEPDPGPKQRWIRLKVMASQ